MKIINEKDYDRKKGIMTEEYVVKYKFVDEEGYTKTATEAYRVTNSKSAHSQVRKFFKKQFPKAEVISVTYQ